MKCIPGGLIWKCECLGQSHIAQLLFKQKIGTAAEVYIKMWDLWLEWTPTTVRWEPWNPWEPHILQCRGSNSLFYVLARCSVIFSHLGHVTMAAEAPDHHSGHLGSLEEARKGQTDTHPVNHREMY